VDDAGLAGVLAEIGGRSGFRVTTHRLEVFGLCAACQEKPA
jgi:Fe2+ or Zn2+ uptake regulation protein